MVLCGKVGKLAICTVLRIEEKYDLELFFKNAGLKNGSGEMPKQKNITTGEKGDVYHLSIPDGLSSNDFSKYKLALEEKYNQKIDIKYEGGFVLIEMFEKIES